MKEHKITSGTSAIGTGAGTGEDFKITSFTDPAWMLANSLKIDCFPWDNGGYKPNTEVKLILQDAKQIHVLYETDETPVLARFRNLNDPVCRDSCMEFFFRPCGDDPRYINFEFNPFGTPYVGFGGLRGDRIKLNDTDITQFDIQTEIHENGWKLMFTIPFAFLKQFYESLEFPWLANFYKCGDDTKRPHWGCWNPIEVAKPDFHRPEYFGVLSV